MDNINFNKVINKQIKKCEELLTKKGIEYDNSTIDRLHSFKRGAAALDVTPKQVLVGYMNKHIMSIYDMCGSSNNYQVELWEEKITDAINYLLLLRAIVEEER